MEVPVGLLEGGGASSLGQVGQAMIHIAAQTRDDRGHLILDLVVPHHGLLTLQDAKADQGHGGRDLGLVHEDRREGDDCLFRSALTCLLRRGVADELVEGKHEGLGRNQAQDLLDQLVQLLWEGQWV
eukprot:16452378-Heterocapsa_arctica.AAC.1